MNKDIRKFLNDHLSMVDIQYNPIKKGGSDRNFYRVRLPSGSTFIFMEYGTEVEENAYWTGNQPLYDRHRHADATDCRL